MRPLPSGWHPLSIFRQGRCQHFPFRGCKIHPARQLMPGPDVQCAQTWRQVLTPIQAGTFMVQTFPYAPDMLALANEVAAEARAPTVAQVFAGVLGGSAEGSTPSSGLSAAATPRSSS